MPRCGRLLGTALLLASAVQGARAATIEKFETKDLSAIIVMGELVNGDEARFADIALGMRNASVILDSPGGSLMAGIEIGRTIHIKGFSTSVAKGDTCASACALAWLGGRRRSLFPRSRVGFHAAYYKDGSGKLVTASSGNALVGAYLNQIGLSSRAIVFVTSAAPSGISWLTQGDALKNDIEMRQVEEGTLASAAAMPVPAEPPRPLAVRPVVPRSPSRANEDWTGYGDWVQVASRRYLEEATAFAEESSRRNANTNVFRYSNGWYGVVIGPFTPGRGVVALDALTRAAEAPPDSLLVRGERFVSLEWGPVPSPKVTASMNLHEEEPLAETEGEGE